MLNRIALAAAVAFALPIASFAQDETTADTVLATVGDTEITVGHLITARDSLPQQYAQLPDDVLFPGLLNQLIQQTVLQQSASGEPSQRVELTLENERRALMAAAAVQQFLENAVTDEQIQAAYEEQYGGAEPATEYHAAHILVETEEEAQRLVEELEGGAEFAALAQQHSTGPTGPNGGDLGWFSAGMMVPDFENAVTELEPGEVSAPVKTQFGWHVIKLLDTRLKEAPPLEDVRAEIEGQLQQEAVQAHIDELVENADVDRSMSEGVDPSVLTQSDLLE